jgi:hypothetical protein
MDQDKQYEIQFKKPKSDYASFLLTPEAKWDTKETQTDSRYSRLLDDLCWNELIDTAYATSAEKDIAEEVASIKIDQEKTDSTHPFQSMDSGIISECIEKELTITDLALI